MFSDDDSDLSKNLSALVALKWLFRALVWCSAIKTDPSLDIKAPHIPSNPKRPVMRPVDLEKFKTLQPHPNPKIATRDAAILELGIAAMLRANEIVGLNVSDINLSTATLRVRHGKGNKKRDVPLTGEPFAKIRAWLEVRPSFVTNRQTEALFLSHSDRNRGGRIGYDGIYNMLRVRFAQMEKPGEAGFGGMHTLRRTGATKFHAANHDLALLQRVLGHENLQTTSIYVALDDAAVRRAMERTAEGKE